MDIPSQQVPQPNLATRPGEPRLPVFLSSSGRMALAYLAALTLAEAMTTLFEPRVGMVMHGLILAAIFLHASLWANRDQRRFLMCLALSPLIRLISLSMPLTGYPVMFWYLIVGAPLFLASYMASQAAKIRRKSIGLTTGKWYLQLPIGLTGFVLGYVEYLILRPAPLAANFTLQDILLPALILFFFTGFLEELIFRGLLQHSAVRTIGKNGYLYSAVVFTVLHLGYKSVLDLFFVMSVALLWGYFTRKTGSIFGVTIAHGFTNIMLFLVCPFLIPSTMMIPSLDFLAGPSITAPGIIAPAPTAARAPSLNLATPTAPSGEVQNPEQSRTGEPSKVIIRSTPFLPLPTQTPTLTRTPLPRPGRPVHDRP